MLTLALIDVDMFKAGSTTCSRMRWATRCCGEWRASSARIAGRTTCRSATAATNLLLVLAGTDLTTGTRVLERLKRASDAACGSAEARRSRSRCSIGIAMHVRGSTISETIAATDDALYPPSRGPGSHRRKESTHRSSSRAGCRRRRLHRQCLRAGSTNSPRRPTRLELAEHVGQCRCQRQRAQIADDRAKLRGRAHDAARLVRPHELRIHPDRDPMPG